MKVRVRSVRQEKVKIVHGGGGGRKKGREGRVSANIMEERCLAATPALSYPADALPSLRLCFPRT